MEICENVSFKVFNMGIIFSFETDFHRKVWLYYLQNVISRSLIEFGKISSENPVALVETVPLRENWLKSLSGNRALMREDEE